MPMFDTECGSGFAQRKALRDMQRMLADVGDMQDDAMMQGKQLVYPVQKQLAIFIVNALMEGDTLILTLCAPMQWGKTGVLFEVAFQMCCHPMKSLPPTNILVITGMSDNEWRSQTKERMLPTTRVWHRADIDKHADELAVFRNGLIFIDECHFGAASSSVLATCLRNAGLLSIAALQERNVRIVQTSATPDHVLENSEKWNEPGGPEYHLKVVPENPTSYTSLRDLRESDRIRPAMDLTSPTNARTLSDVMGAFSTPKWHIVRLPPSRVDKAAVVENLTELSSEYGFGELMRHDCVERIQDVNGILSQAPPAHTIILVKSLWRAAKTLIDDHIGVKHDAYTKGKQSNSSVAQSLAGRSCGHNMNPDVIVYCDVDSVDAYIDLTTNHSFNYHLGGVTNYSSCTIKKVPTAEPVAVDSYAEPSMNDGLPGVPPPPVASLVEGVDYVHGHVFRYLESGETTDALFMRLRREGIMHLRNPFKTTTPSDGFVSASVAKDKKVYTEDEIVTATTWTNYSSGFAGVPKVIDKWTNRLYICYDKDENGRPCSPENPIFYVRRLKMLKL